MVLATRKYCPICEKETQHLNANCIHCTESKEKQRIALWNTKTVEEKLSNLRKRIELLEAGPALY